MYLRRSCRDSISARNILFRVVERRISRTTDCHSWIDCRWLMVFSDGHSLLVSLYFHLIWLEVTWNISYNSPCSIRRGSCRLWFIVSIWIVMIFIGGTSYWSCDWVASQHIVETGVAVSINCIQHPTVPDDWLMVLHVPSLTCTLTLREFSMLYFSHASSCELVDSTAALNCLYSSFSLTFCYQPTKNNTPLLCLRAGLKLNVTN